MNAVGLEIEPATGRIITVKSVPYNVVEDTQAVFPGSVLKWVGYGEVLPSLETAFFDLKTETVRDRPVMPIVVSKTEITADDLDEASISGIPQNAVVSLDGYPLQDFEGSSLELSSVMPATYRVHIECWPFQSYETEIVAT